MSEEQTISVLDNPERYQGVGGWLVVQLTEMLPVYAFEQTEKAAIDRADRWKETTGHEAEVYRVFFYYDTEEGHY